MPRAKKLLVYNSQNYTKYKSQTKRVQEQNEAGKIKVPNNDSSYYETDSYWEDQSKTSVVNVLWNPGGNRGAELAIASLKTNKASKSLVEEMVSANQVSKIHYNQVIIDPNRKKLLKAGLSPDIHQLYTEFTNSKILVDQHAKGSANDTSKADNKSRNKFVQNKSLKDLTAYKEPPKIVNCRVQTNSKLAADKKHNRSASTRKKANDTSLKDNHQPRENELQLWIQNTSPLADHQAQSSILAENKFRRHQELSNFRQRKGSNKDGKRHFESISSRIPNVSKAKFVTQESREPIMLSCLPMISSEPDLENKNEHARNQENETKILPEFVSPKALTNQVSSLINEGIKQHKRKQFVSIQSSGRLAHNYSYTLDNNRSVSIQRQSKRNEKLAIQSGMSTSACGHLVNAQQLCALSPLEGKVSQFSNKHSKDFIIINQLQQIAHFMDEHEMFGMKIKSKPKQPLAYVSKRNIEGKLYMPILKEQGKLSYLFDDKAEPTRRNQPNKVLFQLESPIKLSGTKVAIAKPK